MPHQVRRGNTVIRAAPLWAGILAGMGRFSMVCGPVCLLGSLTACPAGPVDPCAAADDSFIVLGDASSGGFSAFEDGQTIGVVAAPQGGFGVPLLVRTHGLTAASGAKADVRLVVEFEGERVGDFVLAGAALLCREQGGLIAGVVAGFDPEEFTSSEDLDVLDGEQVILDVSVTGSTGREASVRQPVTISVD